MIGSTARPRARLHALLRPDRALARAGRVPVRRQPARRSRCRGRPYIENYRWKPRAGNALHAVRPLQRRGRRRAAHRGLLRLPPRQRLRATTARSWSTCAPTRTRASSRTSTSSGCAPASRWRRPSWRASGSIPRRGTVARERLAEGDLELPRINYGRCNERPYRYAWGIVLRGRAAGSSGSRRSTPSSAPRRSSPSRASTRASRCSWPARRAQDEDDGVLLSVVLDAGAGQLDAARARRGRAAGAGAGLAAPPHPVRLPRPVRPLAQRVATPDLIEGGALGGGARRACVAAATSSSGSRRVPW